MSNQAHNCYIWCVVCWNVVVLYYYYIKHIDDHNLQKYITDQNVNDYLAY